ncbi:hypothetical protein [Natrinema salsiterrestre]|uniref:Fibronectin type-III domain-containing protein n=1 Tax=Natrinema salsiterrestre TaxID=2950540 RepID=A0A9Q4L6I4_9EURY|nr:hypothetical protein [Natrinema salsiterrestre]MDF9748434.1 hypothetical protein [Natrinema salsiterrestre]
MPVQFTTTLPDAEGLDLDGSEPDEITAIWNDVLNNGEYRLEVRETDGNESWGDSGSAIVAYDAVLEQTFVDILDGEKYDVRIRTQTAHVTGNWLEADSITNLPAPNGIGFANVGDTSLEVLWTDNADFEGSYQIYRRRVDYEYDDEGLLVATVGQNTESFVDDTVSPDREYEYFARARTEWVYADTSVGTVTTTSIGLSDRYVPPRGWHVEIDHPSGTTFTPRIQDVQAKPRLNDLPELEITVPEADRWRDEDLEGAPARVWKDGQRQPIDEFVKDTSAPNGITLVLRGGSELDQYVDDVQFDEILAQEGVKQILDEKTGLAYTVDDPSTSTEEDVDLRRIGLSDWEEIIADLPADEPVQDVNGLEVTQTGWWEEAEDASGSDGGESSDLNEGRWSGGVAIEMNSSLHSKSTTIRLDHEVPAANLIFAPLFAFTDGHPPMELLIDGEVADTIPGDALEPTDTIFDLRTFDVAGDDPDSYPDTYSGDVDVELNITGSGDTIYVDGLYAYDSRYTSPPPTGPADDGVIDVSIFPDAYTFETTVSSGFQIVGGALEVEMPDTSRSQRVRISNDGGNNWISANNSQTVSGDFASASNEIIAQVRLGGYDSDPTETPGIRDAPQVLERLTLSADLNDTPQLIDYYNRGSLREILREIADDGNWIWELQWDDDVGGLSLEWTQPGLRTATTDQSLVDYQVGKDVRERYDRAVIFGGSRSVEGDEFVADAPGDLRGLEEQYIKATSETVYDPSNPDTVFERRTDYTIEWDIGAIAITDSGDMVQGETYAVDYQYKIRGEYEIGGETNPDTIEKDISTANSQFEAEQIALGIVKEVSQTPIEAEVTIARDDVGFALTETVDLEELPVDRPLRVRGINNSPEQIVLQLGSGQRPEDVIPSLSEKVGRVSRQV